MVLDSHEPHRSHVSSMLASLSPARAGVSGHHSPVAESRSRCPPSPLRLRIDGGFPWTLRARVFAAGRKTVLDPSGRAQARARLV
jgi:hypothetical protein